MDMLKKWVTLVLIPSVFWSSSYAEDVCVKKSACSCEFANGTGIDLTPAVKSTFYTAQYYGVKNNGTQYELQTYYFHPCVDIDPKFNSTSKNDTCGHPLSICRHKNTMVIVNATSHTFQLDEGVYNFMGEATKTGFSSDGKSIIYENGPSSNEVLLVCAQTDSMLQVYSLTEPDDIVLTFYSREACLKNMEEAGRSFGSTLCIIFFSFVIFYLLLGVLTRKFLMGATGLEVVPNLPFWMDLPNLVRDGWSFTINGFKLQPRGAGPTLTPDPNSYDSI